MMSKPVAPHTLRISTLESKPSEVESRSIRRFLTVIPVGSKHERTMSHGRLKPESSTVRIVGYVFECVASLASPCVMSLNVSATRSVDNVTNGSSSTQVHLRDFKTPYQKGCT